MADITKQPACQEQLNEVLFPYFVELNPDVKREIESEILQVVDNRRANTRGFIQPMYHPDELTLDQIESGINYAGKLYATALRAGNIEEMKNSGLAMLRLKDNARLNHEVVHCNLCIVARLAAHDGDCVVV